MAISKKLIKTVGGHNTVDSDEKCGSEIKQVPNPRNVAISSGTGSPEFSSRTGEDGVAEVINADSIHHSGS
jgi:hypothetical protein